MKFPPRQSTSASCAPRWGFTMVELLVSATVFLIVLVTVVNVILLFVKGPLNQTTEKELQSDLDYFYEQVFQNLPWSTVNYDAYGGSVTNPETKLHAITQYQNSSDNVTVYLDSGRIWVDDSVHPVFPATGADTVVTTLEFYIYPATDPFDLNTSPLVNNQPMVIVYVQAHAADDPTIELSYQFMLTSRYYTR